jgi:hypothetical protein
MTEEDGMQGISWERQRPTDAGKGSLGARVRRSQLNGPGKRGRKRSLLVDGRGVSLSLVVNGADVRDSKLMEQPSASNQATQRRRTGGSTQTAGLDGLLWVLERTHS